MNALILATLLQLSNGLNPCAAAGEIAFVDCLTAKASYTVTNTLASVTCSNHAGTNAPTGKFAVGSGYLLVEGADPWDHVSVIVK